MSIIGKKTRLQKTKTGRFFLKIYHYCYAIPISNISRLKYKIGRKKYKKIQFYTYDETFYALTVQNKSLSRFGDGEIAWIYKDAKGYFGQENSDELSENLRKVIMSDDQDILIGVPDFFGEMQGYDNRRKKSREVHLAKYGNRWMELLDDNKTYVDALITRVYLGRSDINYENTFNLWKNVWNNRRVTLIEGEKTCFGVGNDLLDNVAQLERIIAPAENAYSKYEDIFQTALLYDKNTLFLIALGPTATVLAYALSRKGYQAIDIGHLDIEYEWYLSGTKEKKKVVGKYVNEAGGMPSQELSENNKIKYLAEIKYII